MRLAIIWGLSAAVLLAGCSQSDGDTVADTIAPVALETQVLTPATAAASEEEWGIFVQYFAGDTAGLSDLLSGKATILPGLEIHPPHRHSEEEFLMVVEGRGEWTVGDETFEAGEGDMLYAAAWDLHGIKNTGEEPLTFVFWKAHPKGMPVPADPQQ